MAAKTNASGSEIDKTSFWWVGLCGICHPGGGPAELDRDGELYYDVATGQFGYEKLGKNAGDVALDGDYSEFVESTGAMRLAPWDKTGIAEVDCLLCHRADVTINGGTNMHWVWHAAALRGRDKLVDSGGGGVPAYASAATVSQGWFADLVLASVPPGKPPMASSVDLDYAGAVTAGKLFADPGGLKVSPAIITGTPPDYACWGCHVTPDLKKRGRTWFDPATDVHYAGFNNLDDADPANDVPAEQSKACTTCHPSGDTGGAAANHNFAKGHATLGSVRNDTDYLDFRTCADCHLASSPDRDPAAPVPPTNTFHNSTHRAVMSCETCHIPYKTGAADLVVDNAAKGATISYSTSDLLSADPLDPADPDKSRWYPSFVWKMDRDGVTRMFPVKLLLSVWWGDWKQNGTPTLADDVVAPIPLWKVRQVTGGAVPAFVADGNVNTDAEIYQFIQSLKANDSFGNPIALNPVLIKGGSVYYDDGAGGVASFEYEGTGIKTESSHPFSVNHNVLPTSETWGNVAGCSDCHGSTTTPVFDRRILVDPFDPSGNPVYRTVREILGIDPW